MPPLKIPTRRRIPPTGPAPYGSRRWRERRPWQTAARSDQAATDRPGRDLAVPNYRMVGLEEQGERGP